MTLAGFGFVFVGYSVGLSASPLLFGWFLDQDMPEWVFVCAGLFSIAALIAAALAQRQTPALEPR